MKIAKHSVLVTEKGQQLDFRRYVLIWFIFGSYSVILYVDWNFCTLKCISIGVLVGGRPCTMFIIWEFSYKCMTRVVFSM